MRNHYHLPAQLGSFAVLKYNNARSFALEEKKKLLDKEGAVAILRQESKGLGLIYTEKKERSGFTLPTRFEKYWLIKPKKNTIIGKRIQTEMDNVCELINKWQWALEDALNLQESVYAHQQWDLTVCFPMPDGSVLVSQPQGAKKMISQDYHISPAEFERLKGLAHD
jgi:hypothetical protein